MSNYENYPSERRPTRNVRRPDVSNKPKKPDPVIQLKREPREFELAEAIELLINAGGDIEKFSRDYLGTDPSLALDRSRAVALLLKLERELQEHPELWHKWNAVIKHSTRIRMQLIKCKALKMAEGFCNLSATSNAPEVSFIAKLLTPEIAGQTQLHKKTVDARYNPYMKTGKVETALEELEELQDQMEDPLDEIDMSESA